MILSCGLHDVFFNANNFLHNMPTIWLTPSNELWTIIYFAKLLRTIFDEDDDPKDISSDNKLVIWIVSSKFKAKN